MSCSINKIDMKKIKINSFAVGAGLFAIPVFSLLISSLLFACGLSINPFIFPISVILSFLVVYLITKENKEEFVPSVLLSFSLLLLALFMSGLFNDGSWDGQTYHQDAILALKNGWNPIYEHHALHSFNSLWVDHYPKGIETISATIYSTTGEIECGKALNFIILFSTFFFCFRFLVVYFSFLPTWKKIFFSAIFALCPVTVYQLFTFYIDWSLYSLLLILIVTLICNIKIKSIYNLFVVGFVIFFSVCIKFNLFFWVGITIISFLIYWLIAKKYDLVKKIVVVSFLGSLFGIFFAGFNPYITNTLDHNNPFYPLSGEEKVDVITWQTPEAIRYKHRDEQVFISLFSFTSNNLTGPTVLAFPSNLSKHTFNSSIGHSDPRIGGFGVFFSWILILAFALYNNNSVVKNGKRSLYSVFLLVLFLSLFLLPGGWNARYIPIFYIFPLIMLLYLEYQNKPSIWVKSFKRIAYALIIVDLCLVVFFSIKLAKEFSKMLDNYVYELSQSKELPKINFGYNMSLKIKLDKKNIKYEETSEALDLPIYAAHNVYLSSEQFTLNETGIPKPVEK